MRLRPAEVGALVAALDSRLKRRAARLYLFGSRTQNRLKGGDIDLLLLAPPTVIKALRAQKHRLLAEFKKELGERRIDLTLADSAQSRRDPFVRRALLTAVPLRSWRPRRPGVPARDSGGHRRRDQGVSRKRPLA